MKHTAQTALSAIAALCAVGISVPANCRMGTGAARLSSSFLPAPGGGADQMARTIQGIVTKHNLMKQPMVVINKSGGAGGEGFLDLKASVGQSAQDHHHAVEPLHHAACDRDSRSAGRISRRWRCWRSTSSCSGSTPTSRTRPSKDYVDAVKAAPAGTIKMGGTGSKQEDQIITVARREGDRRQVHLHSLQGRRRSRRSAGRQPRRFRPSTIRSRRSAQWRGGKLRPLCVFDAQADGL